MNMETAVTRTGPALKAAMLGYKRRALKLGCETRGPVEVPGGVWAMAKADGWVEVWHRRPTPAETRAAIGASPRRAKEAKPRPVQPAADVPPESPSARRVRKLF